VNKSNAATPPPPSGTASPAPPSTPKLNGGTPSDKDKAPLNKGKDKKGSSRRDSKSGRNTPEVPPKNAGTPTVPEASSTSTPEPTNVSTTAATTEQSKSPEPANSTGGPGNVRSPKPKRHHPWTIFMKMPSTIQVTDADVREFFVDAKDGVSTTLDHFHVLSTLKFFAHVIK
jgi:hypothetical protein